MDGSPMTEFDVHTSHVREFDVDPGWRIFLLVESAASNLIVCIYEDTGTYK